MNLVANKGGRCHTDYSTRRVPNGLKNMWLASISRSEACTGREKNWAAAPGKHRACLSEVGIQLQNSMAGELWEAVKSSVINNFTGIDSQSAVSGVRKHTLEDAVNKIKIENYNDHSGIIIISRQGMGH